MSRLRSTLIPITLALIASLGCASGAAPTLPNTTPLPSGTVSENPDETALAAEHLGAIEVSMGPDGQPTIALLDRTGQFPVYSHVLRATLLEAHYSILTRTWTLNVALTNLTPFTAYGPWVTFFDLNGNTILNADGYATLDGGGDSIWYAGAGQFKPLIAYGKDQPARMWPGGSTLVATWQIRWPEGVDDFNGLKGYIDISYPGPRNEPVVEQPIVLPCVAEGAGGECLTAVIAPAIDLQSPGVPLPVFLGFDLDGVEHLLPMVDDGTGLDGVAGDLLYTGVIPFDPRGIVPAIGVVALDYEGNHFLHIAFVE